MPRILVRDASGSGADWTWRTNSSARLRSSVDSFANWESGELRNRLEDSQFCPYRTEMSQVTVGDSGGNRVAVKQLSKLLTDGGIDVDQTEARAGAWRPDPAVAPGRCRSGRHGDPLGAQLLIQLSRPVGAPDGHLLGHGCRLRRGPRTRRHNRCRRLQRFLADEQLLLAAR